MERLTDHIQYGFKRDLSGWQMLGVADASREPQGRTSVVRLGAAPSPQPGRVGLALSEVAVSVQRSERYVASAWVRSSAPGQQVVLRLVGTGGKQSSHATATALPGLAWRRVIVDHTATTRADLSLGITGDAVPPATLLVDEVVVCRG